MKRRKTQATDKKKGEYLRLVAFLRTWDIPRPEREFEFHHLRGWRFDLAWASLGVAVEIQGGNFNFQAQKKKLLGLLSLARGRPLSDSLYKEASRLVASMQGRHASGPALRSEYEKLNAAQLDGWRVLLVLPEDLFTRRFVEMVREALSSAQEERELLALSRTQEKEIAALRAEQGRLLAHPRLMSAPERSEEITEFPPDLFGVEYK